MRKYNPVHIKFTPIIRHGQILSKECTLTVLNYDPLLMLYMNAKCLIKVEA